MQRDRKSVFVDAPELLEQHLGLAARVHEYERGAVPADEIVDFRQCVARRVPGPGQVLGGVEHRHFGLRATCCNYEIGVV